MVNEFFDGTYYNPDNTAQDTYMNSVSYEKYSIKQSEISFPPPIGCVYNLTRE
jgi:hypothetical protein